MDTRRRRWTRWIAVTMVLTAGCTTTVRVPVTRPAKINLHRGGLNRVAIGEAKGNCGASLADHLTSRLVTCGRFEVLDRQHIERVMEEHRLTLLGVTGGSTSSKLGELTGASVLLFVDSTSRYDKQRYRGKPRRDSKGRVSVTYSIEGNLVLNTTFKVVDLSTGKILAAEVFTDKESDTERGMNGWPREPSESSLLSKAAGRTLDRIMRLIAPYEQTVAIRFKSSKIPEVKRGIAYTKQGMWAEALECFQAAEKANPDDPEAKYCLGVAYEHTRMFPEAIGALKAANVLQPCARYTEEIENVKRLEKELCELGKQGVTPGAGDPE